MEFSKSFYTVKEEVTLASCIDVLTSIVTNYAERFNTFYVSLVSAFNLSYYFQISVWVVCVAFQIPIFE